MVLFENAQWQVQDWGLASRNPPAPMVYEIEASRLLEQVAGLAPDLYDWPGHMAEKTWVNVHLFLEAYEEAVKLLKEKLGGTVDQAMMDRSFARARKTAADRR